MAEQVEGKSQSVDTGMGFGVSTGLEGLVPDSRLQELDKELQNKIKEKFPEGAPKTDPSKEKEPKNKLPDSTASEDDPSELLKKTTFFNKTIIPKEEIIEFKTWEDTAKYLSENTGLEIKESSDIPKMISEFKTLKENSGKAQEYEQKVKGYEQIFNAIPDEVFGIVQAALKNEDYRTLMKDLIKETIDFNIPFDKQDKKEMLNYFYPGKFSEEDYEDEDNSAVKFALGEASKKYSDAKKVNESKPTFKQKFEEKSTAEKKLINETAITSWNTFSQGKQIDDSRKDKIGSILEGGWNAVYKTLFDEKGGWKPEAAEKIFWMQYATEELAIAERVIAAKAKTRAVEEIIDRGNDKPNTQGNSKGSPSITKEEAAKELTKILIS